MSEQTKQIGQAAWDAVHNHGAFRRDFPNDDYLEAVGAAVLAAVEHAHPQPADERWLFSRRHDETQEAWTQYRSIASRPEVSVPVLFSAGFTMGVSAAQAVHRSVEGEPSDAQVQAAARELFNRARPGNEYADLTYAEVRAEYEAEARAALRAAAATQTGESR